MKDTAQINVEVFLEYGSLWYAVDCNASGRTRRSQKMGSQKKSNGVQDSKSLSSEVGKGVIWLTITSAIVSECIEKIKSLFSFS